MLVFRAISDCQIRLLCLIEKREQLLFFAMLLVAVVMPGGAALFCGRMGVDRVLSGWGGVTSLCARRGDPVCACTGIRGRRRKGADCDPSDQVL